MQFFHLGPQGIELSIFCTYLSITHGKEMGLQNKYNAKIPLKKDSRGFQEFFQVQNNDS